MRRRFGNELETLRFVERSWIGQNRRRGIAYELSFLSRSVRDLADLAERSRPKGKQKGWGLILLDIDVDTSSPNGEFMLNVMGSAAQWERRIISQRTKDALAVKRAQGVRLGRPSMLTTSSSNGSSASSGWRVT